MDMHLTFMLLFVTFANSTADGMLGNREREKSPCRVLSFILGHIKHSTVTTCMTVVFKCNKT